MVLQWVWLLIFEFFDTQVQAVSRLVCKEWDRIARQPQYWKHIELNNTRLETCTFLKAFAHAIKTIQANQPEILQVTAKEKVAALWDFVANCGQLEELHMNNVELCQEEGEHMEVKFPPTLRVFEWRGNFRMHEDVAEALQELEHLETFEVGWLSESGIGDAPQSAFPPITATIETVPVIKPTLKRLWLPGCYEVSPLLMNWINKNKQLTHVNLLYHPQIHFFPLGGGCPHLVHCNLRASSAGDETATRLAQNCPKLTYVNFSCTKITITGLEALTTAVGKTLKTLDLCYAKQLANADVATCVVRCPKVTMIGLGGMNGLTDNNMADIVDSCADVEHIGVGGCKALTNAAFSAMQKWKKLNKLNAHNVGAGVTRDAVEALLQAVPSIQAVEFSDTAFADLNEVHPYTYEMD